MPPLRTFHPAFAGCSVWLLFCVLMSSYAPATARGPAGARPDDNPCVTWRAGGCHGGLNVEDYVPAIYSAWQWHPDGNSSGHCTPCSGQPGDMSCAYIFPCFGVSEEDTPNVDVWGHHDVLLWGQGEPCNTQRANGSNAQVCTQWWAGKGPQWQRFGWQLSQRGTKPDTHAGQLIQYKGKVLARMTSPSPYANCGPGNVGWVPLQPDGSLGCMHYAAYTLSNCMDSFEVAICKACKPCPTPYNSSFDPGPGCPNNCSKPKPNPPPPPPPPPPPGGTPCVRFGHAIASPNHVDIEIVQDGVKANWTNYHFGQFSDWFNQFHGGFGTITVWENTAGARGAQLLTARIPLTPGPLVVVIKDKWPPTEANSVETIAASFVPPTTGSKVRLFNLAMDVPTASLENGAKKTLVTGIKYTLGSEWVAIPASSDTFSAQGNGKTLATAPMTPPDAPQVWTAFLLGDAGYGYTVMPLIDAPEYGPCRPATWKLSKPVGQ